MDYQTSRAGVRVRVPDLASALSLKGAAFELPAANRGRHLQDAVTLFSCAAGGSLELSKSMRPNVNRLVNALGEVDAWAMADPLIRRRAVQAITRVRPDWAVPGFVLPQQPSRRSVRWEQVTPSDQASVRMPERRQPPSIQPGGRRVER